MACQWRCRRGIRVRQAAPGREPGQAGVAGLPGRGTGLRDVPGSRSWCLKHPVGKTPRPHAWYGNLPVTGVPDSDFAPCTSPPQQQSTLVLSPSVWCPPTDRHTGESKAVPGPRHEVTPLKPARNASGPVLVLLHEPSPAMASRPPLRPGSLRRACTPQPPRPFARRDPPEFSASVEERITGQRRSSRRRGRYLKRNGIRKIREQALEKWRASSRGSSRRNG